MERVIKVERAAKEIEPDLRKRRTSRETDFMR
jgi:hypothetical protein